MGYPDGVKGYKFWCPTLRKCIISKDVIFHEDDMVQNQKNILVDIDAQTSKKKVEFKVELQDISSKQPKQFEEQEGNDDVQNTDEQDADHIPT